MLRKLMTCALVQNLSQSRKTEIKLQHTIIKIIKDRPQRNLSNK